MVTQSVIQAPAQPLVSNGYTLAGAPNRLGRLQPTDPAQPLAALHEQYTAQGYLWLKGILPRDEILTFRRRFFAAYQDAGLLAPGSDPVEGLYAGDGGEDKEAMRQLTTEIVQWAAYEAFCLLKPIVAFYEAFLGGPVYLHKRKLIRFTKPNDPNCTGAHYDLTYLRGAQTVCVPVGFRSAIFR